jgi:hypothetical protein
MFVIAQILIPWPDIFLRLVLCSHINIFKNWLISLIDTIKYINNTFNNIQVLYFLLRPLVVILKFSF